MEVNPSDPGRDADTEHKADKRPGCANSYRLGSEKAVQQTSGGAECFHNGEVAAPVEHPSHQRGEHAKGGSQNDKRGRGEQRGSSLAEHPSLSLHDLAYGAHISRGQRCSSWLMIAATSSGEPFAATSMVDGWTPVQETKSVSERKMRLSSAAPVRSDPAGVRWMVRP